MQHEQIAGVRAGQGSGIQELVLVPREDVAAFAKGPSHNQRLR
jgi:hypothetical protein